MLNTTTTHFSFRRWLAAAGAVIALATLDPRAAVAQNALLPIGTAEMPASAALAERQYEAEAWQEQAERWQAEAQDWKREAADWRGRAETWRQEAIEWQQRAQDLQTQAATAHQEAARWHHEADSRAERIATLERDLAENRSTAQTAPDSYWRDQAQTWQAEAAHWEQEALTLRRQLDDHTAADAPAGTAAAARPSKSPSRRRRFDYMGDRRW